MKLKPIGHMKSPYATKFGVPRQPGLVHSAESQLILLDDARTDMKFDFKPGERCVLVWAFSYNIVDGDSWSKTVRPPLLGGTRRIGVFATRSSFRPNNLAISCATITAVKEAGPCFQGCDLVDGTPVLMVIPYDEDRLSYPNASEGWRTSTLWPAMDSVIFPRSEIDKIPVALRDDVCELLRQDPRPAYTRHGQEERVYWVQYDEFVIWFGVDGRDLVVSRVHHLDAKELDIIHATGNLPSLLQE